MGVISFIILFIIIGSVSANEMNIITINYNNYFKFNIAKYGGIVLKMHFLLGAIYVSSNN